MGASALPTRARLSRSGSSLRSQPPLSRRCFSARRATSRRFVCLFRLLLAVPSSRRAPDPVVPAVVVPALLAVRSSARLSPSRPPRRCSGPCPSRGCPRSPISTCPGRSRRALEREGVTEPFPIQAATLPNSLAGRDVLGRGRTGSGKTLAFGLAAAGPHRRTARRAPPAAGPGPRPHPGAGPAGHRRAHPVRPVAEAAAGHRRRRHVDRPAGRRAARRRRGRRRHARPAQGPHRPRRLPAGPGRHHRARRGRPDGRHGLHAAGHRAARPAPRRRAADAVLRHPGPQRRPAGPPLPHRPGRPLGRPVGRRGHDDGAPRAARPRRRQARATHRDRRPRRPGDHVPGHQARRRPAHQAPAEQRRTGRGAARRQVPAAAHPHPGRSSRPGTSPSWWPPTSRPAASTSTTSTSSSTSTRRPTTRTTCTAAAAPPAPASPAASSPSSPRTSGQR